MLENAAQLVHAKPTQIEDMYTEKKKRSIIDWTIPSGWNREENDA